MRRWLLLLLALAAARPARAGSEVALTVSAAASLTDVLREIKALYLKEYPEQTIALNLGASVMLQVQIEGGAPVDVFASAALEPVRQLVLKGIVDSADVRIFAGNRLVVIVPRDAPHGSIRDLEALRDPRIRRIAVGDEKTAPAGMYALQSLRHHGLLEVLQERLVPATNVRQVVEYVASGAAEAGIVYATDVKNQDQVVPVCQIPAPSHEPILYPIVMIRRTEYPVEAEDFIRFVLGPRGQAALASWGFRPASEMKGAGPGDWGPEEDEPNHGANEAPPAGGSGGAR